MSIDSLAVERDNETLRVELAQWAGAAAAAHDAGFTYFCFLSAMDWLPNPDLDGEKVFVADREPTPPQEIVVDPLVRKAGGASRFQLIARVYDVARHMGLTLTTDLDESLRAPSWTSVFAGADWHERETWEMFGITFDGHPGLRHLYLPEGFEGHPLRKDYPLLAREVRPWPGLVDMEEMPTQQPEEMPKVDEAQPGASTE